MLKSKRAAKRQISIKWKMFAIVLAFIVVVISIIWFFQVGMLEDFYRNAKFRELHNTADKIEDALINSRDMEDIVYESTEEYYSSIIVFEVKDRVATPIVEAIQPTNSIMHYFSKIDLQKLYDSARERNGNYVASVSHNLNNNNGRVKIEFSEYNGSYFSFSDYSTKSALDIRIFISNGTEYVILQTSELSPVAAMVRTLNAQFLWIGIILIFISLLLVMIMSKFITKPIIRMNFSAQKLALGDYGAEFEENGYREISELSQTLNYTSHELAKTDKYQKELISNVSHDLRTPLTMIKGYAEVVRDIPDENTPENIQVIIDETERLTALVNDMLDASKLKARTREPDMHLFSLTQAISDTMRRYEKLTEQYGYRIDFVEDAEVFVYADSVMMLQVVYNLINNAINYTGEDKTITVRQTLSDGKVRISVTDTGDGIPKEDLPLIWERYYKVDKVHKRAAVGTGLGLSIAREILTLHNAKFGVLSAQGQGATFWFELDVAEKEEYEQ